jgi:hypothetical protein
VSRNPLSIFANTADDEDQPEDVALERREDDTWLWSRFCGAVWDSLGKGAARDITSFQNACTNLWTSFVQPIRDGAYGARDFSKLMVRNRVLFQGETALVERLVPLAANDPMKKILKGKLAQDSQQTLSISADNFFQIHTPFPISHPTSSAPTSPPITPPAPIKSSS